MKLYNIFFKTILPAALLAAVLFLVPGVPLALEDHGKTLNYVVSMDSPAVYDRVLYHAFANIGYKITMGAAPMGYAIQMANSGEYDGLAHQARLPHEEYPRLIEIPEAIAKVKFQVFGNTGFKGEIKSWDDLAGLRVGTLFNKYYIEKNLPQGIASHTQKSSFFELCDALLSGECDVVVSSFFVDNAEQTYPPGIKVVAEIDFIDAYAFVNEKHADLAPLVAASLKKMKEDGTVDKILHYENDGKSPKVVLHISSYYPEDVWDHALIESIQDIVERNGFIYRNIPLYSNRFKSDYERAKNAYSAIRTMFLHAPPSVVVASDNNALTFSSSYYDILFSGLPVVFCGINGEVSGLWKLGKNYSGIWESTPVHDMIDFVAKLYPETRGFFIINDYSETGLKFKEEISEKLDVYKGRFDIQYNEDVSQEQIAAQVRALPKGYVPLMGSYAWNSHNPYLSRQELHTLVAKNSDRPVFSMGVVGFGALGGKMASAKKHGDAVGEMAVKVLKGQPVSSIASIPEGHQFNRWVFDAAVMEKYGLNRSDFPPESTFINEKLTFYQVNPQAFLLFVALLVLAFMVIVGLVIAVWMVNGQKRRLIYMQDSLHTSEELREKDKKVLAQIGASVRLLENLLNSIESMIYVTDAETDKLMFANKKLAAHFRMTDNDLGEVCWKVLKKSDASECSHCQRVRTREVLNEPVVWEGYDNDDTKHFRHFCKLLKWPDGRMVYLREAIDITEIRNAELTLQRRLEQQELAATVAQRFLSNVDAGQNMESAMRMVGEFLQCGRILLTIYDEENGELEQRLEWRSEQMGHDDAACVKPFKPGNFFYDELKNGGKPHLLFNFDNRCPVPSNEASVPDSLAVAITVDGKFVGMLRFELREALRPWSDSEIHLSVLIGSIFAAVHTREVMEQRLKKMSVLMEKSPYVVSVIDRNMRLTHANPASYGATGYTQDELRFKGLECLHPPEVFEYIKNTLLPIAMSEGIVSADLPILRKDGTERIFNFVFFAISGLGVGSMELGAIASDVTDRKILAEELVEAKNSAEDANRAKSIFLSNMSHELRTPISALLGMLDIAGKSDNAEQVKSCLTKMDTASRSLLHIINNILDMSKIESGKFELLCERFEIKRSLADIMEVVRIKLSEKNQEVVVRIADDVPVHLSGDYMRLNQIVLNLLTNAGKFSEAGKKIYFSVRLENKSASSALLKFTVTDEGIGISEENIKFLCQPFQQADSSITKRFGGTGLGLSISRKIVEMMGGTLTIESREGQGSTFAFTAKFGIGDIADALSPHCEYGGLSTVKMRAERKSLSEYSGMRILLAEDIDINREIVSYLLEEMQLKVVEACNGQEAIEIFEQNPENFDLILMDIQMPVLDGYSAARAIRQSPHPRGSAIPIIALTANAFNEDVEHALAAGMNGHLSKPIDNKRFKEVLENFL